MMVQFKGMTIYCVICIDPFLKGALIRIPYLFLSFTNKLKKIQNLPWDLAFKEGGGGGGGMRLLNIFRFSQSAVLRKFN